MIHTDFGEQSLKARTIAAAFSTDTLVIVNDQNTFFRPAQVLCMLAKGVLSFPGLTILTRLLR